MAVMVSQGDIYLFLAFFPPKNNSFFFEDRALVNYLTQHILSI